LPAATRSDKVVTVAVSGYARAARLERALEKHIGRLLLRRGWVPTPVAYLSYGRSRSGGRVDSSPSASPDPADGTGWVRVLARVLLLPGGPRKDDASAVERLRGWRSFFTVASPDTAVSVRVDGQSHELLTRGDGYLDEVVPADLAPGWHELALDVKGSRASTRVRVVDPAETVGVVSDVDDTVIITALPRPLVAFWNTFVRQESSRRPVPGMASFLREAGRGGFLVYLSTGAWNYAPVLQRFLARHRYPAGPMLLTDWGPSPDRWFRSGQDHKRHQLRRLAAELPEIRWVLVGDDGQHDPALYEEFVTEHPGRSRLVAIRQLSAVQQVLTHGVPGPSDAGTVSVAGTGAGAEVPRIVGRDGYALLDELPDAWLRTAGP